MQRARDAHDDARSMQRARDAHDDARHTFHLRPTTMAAVSWDTFERYRQKGLDARRAGQWESARIYLLEAARSMVELSKEAQGEDLREGRREMANRLLELARDCDEAKRENRKTAGVSRKPSSAAESSDDEDGKNASD